MGGDDDCQGQTEKVRKAAPDTQDMTCGRVKNAKDEVDEDKKRRNRTKAGVRAKAEWLFRIIKRIFGRVKMRCRGLQKNHK